MLSLENVSAGYGGFQALFDVSLEVKAGESVAVIGPNGAGKTTLLRVISKLIDPTAGEIRMDGAALTAVPAHEVIARGIAHVPDNRRLFARLSVEENMKMGSFVFSSRTHFPQRLEFVYGLFPRMKERRNQLAGTLSGGEQQMCAIGRALMARPKLLMLDEPSLGLAPIFVEKIFEIVHEINQQGTPILLVEQNALVALGVAHRGYVLETGRVALEGPAGELRQNEQVRKTYLGES